MIKLLGRGGWSQPELGQALLYPNPLLSQRRKNPLFYIVVDYIVLWHILVDLYQNLGGRGTSTRVKVILDPSALPTCTTR